MKEMNTTLRDIFFVRISQIIPNENCLINFTETYAGLCNSNLQSSWKSEKDKTHVNIFVVLLDYPIIRTVFERYRL